MHGQMKLKDDVGKFAKNISEQFVERRILTFLGIDQTKLSSCAAEHL
jgi:hypothetical protein